MKSYPIGPHKDWTSDAQSDALSRELSCLMGSCGNFGAHRGPDFRNWKFSVSLSDKKRLNDFDLLQRWLNLSQL